MNAAADLCDGNMTNVLTNVGKYGIMIVYEKTDHGQTVKRKDYRYVIQSNL